MRHIVGPHRKNCTILVMRSSYFARVVTRCNYRCRLTKGGGYPAWAAIAARPTACANAASHAMWVNVPELVCVAATGKLPQIVTLSAAGTISPREAPQVTKPLVKLGC